MVVLTDWLQGELSNPAGRAVGEEPKTECCCTLRGRDPALLWHTLFLPAFALERVFLGHEAGKTLAVDIHWLVAVGRA